MIEGQRPVERKLSREPLKSPVHCGRATGRLGACHRQKAMVEFQNDMMDDAKADALAIASAYRAASVSNEKKRKCLNRPSFFFSVKQGS